MNEENTVVSSEENNENINLDEDVNTENEEVSSEDNKLEEENNNLKAEVESLKDKMLRLSAEYDNYRKRSTREKSEIYSGAYVDVISQILPILDNLERASSVDSDIDSLKQGINMVVKLFYDILGKMDVKEIDTTGEFDPNMHEAVMHISDESLEQNTIVEVLQKGFIKNDKVIRHSMVKVAN